MNDSASSCANAPLILASASPRRLDLLRQAGVEPDRAIAADVDERALAKETPRQLALRLAQDKARAVMGLEAGAFVVGADTCLLYTSPRARRAGMGKCVDRGGAAPAPTA